MKFLFMSTILMFLFLKSMNMHGLVMISDQNQSDMQSAMSLTKDGETEASDEDTTDTVRNGKLPTDILVKVYDVAKNVSHSKGIFMNNERKDNAYVEPQVRRSILRKISLETESEVMKNILNTFKSDLSKLKTLDQIEYLVHQYDVAVDFAKMGGIEIVTPFLFSSDDQIASSVASVLGAAMQSNPTVQKLALKNNVGRNLLKLLSHKSPIVLSRVIFALSSFLRNMPEAQEEFFATDGISKLADILKNHEISTNVKLKIINLFNDLSVELKELQIYSSDPGSISQRERLFPEAMQNCDICKLVPSFLDLEDYGIHEKVVSAMISLSSVCLKDFQREEIRCRIKELIKLYNPLEDGSSPFYAVIDIDLRLDLLGELISLLNKIFKEDIFKDKNKTVKTELYKSTMSCN